MGERAALRDLTRVFGVQAAYTDVDGRRRTASAESQLSVLRLLGAPVERMADVPGALREWTSASGRRLLEPVAVTWGGDDVEIALRCDRRELPDRLDCRLDREDEEVLQQRFSLADLPRGREIDVDGESFVEIVVRIPGPLPPGYHRLRVEAGPRSGESLVIVAPRRAFGARRPREGRDWGVFLPLYALHGERSWGAGSYADLGRLADWTAQIGGGAVGTLPLLPTFSEDLLEPSPYLPVSRLMWNELHIAVDEVPELRSSSEARALLASSGFRRRIARLRASPEVDHRRQTRLQRSVMEHLAAVGAGRPPRSESFRRFLRAHPAVADYARFRAAMERRRAPWYRWPVRQRRGELRSTDYDPSVERYHAFSQWIAAEQFEAVASRARERGVHMVLDLPLGVHPAGYDVWRHRDLFANGASVGAPPDTFFSGGQTWSIPPLIPRRSRDLGHAYFAACVRHHMRPAGMLRIDHVMSLHRLYWIPDGHGPRDGVYVRYPADELYAVLCLESWRHRCVVVGEDLGTVPREVRTAMRKHGLRRTCVVQYGSGDDPNRPLESMDIRGVVSLRTHDMPTFAGFWRGIDLAQRRRLGHLSPAEVRRERRARSRLKDAWSRDLRRGGWLDVRQPSTAEALRAAIAFLADSPADTVIVDLEDLWGELRRQNVPGTTDEHPNWRRKARHSLDVFARMPRVLRTLGELRRRRGGI